MEITCEQKRKRAVKIPERSSVGHMDTILDRSGPDAHIKEKEWWPYGSHTGSQVLQVKNKIKRHGKWFMFHPRGIF